MAKGSATILAQVVHLHKTPSYVQLFVEYVFPFVHLFEMYTNVELVDYPSLA